MFRFFVEERNEDYFYLTPEVQKHLKVARINGEFIAIHEGKFFVVEQQGGKTKLVRELDESHEYASKVIIAPTLMSMKRFEWLIQKATELGVTEIQPVISQNMSVRIPTDFQKKLSRWNEIAKNSAEQAFRNVYPIVKEPISFEEALEIEAANKYIAYVKEDSTPETYQEDVVFFTGPEGGYTPEEIELAKSKGVKVTSLGKRILRAETAPIMMLSKII